VPSKRRVRVLSPFLRTRVGHDFRAGWKKRREIYEGELTEGGVGVRVKRCVPRMGDTVFTHESRKLRVVQRGELHI